jgi:hypothetical protein
VHAHNTHLYVVVNADTSLRHRNDCIVQFVCNTIFVLCICESNDIHSACIPIETHTFVNSYAIHAYNFDCRCCCMLYTVCMQDLLWHCEDRAACTSTWRSIQVIMTTHTHFRLTYVMVCCYGCANTGHMCCTCNTSVVLVTLAVLYTVLTVTTIAFTIYRRSQAAVASAALY